MRSSYAAIVLATASLLSACGNDFSDLETYVAEVKARKSSAIAPIPQLKQYEAFAFESGERRDPFTQVEKRSGNAQGPQPNLNRNREPLEEYPLDALRMVGTINTPAGAFALVKAPDNVVHRVTIKNYMGQNYGEIVGISETEVSLLELVPDGFGSWVQRPASLALAQ